MDEVSSQFSFNNANNANALGAAQAAGGAGQVIEAVPKCDAPVDHSKSQNFFLVYARICFYFQAAMMCRIPTWLLK